MKNLKKLFFTLILIACSITFITKSFAYEVVQNKNELTLTNTIDTTYQNKIDNNYFKTEETVKLEDTSISGDTFVLCKTANLENIEISGSLFIVAQDINLENVEVTGTIYIAGQNLELKAISAKNIYGSSQSFEITGNSNINNDVKVACASAKIEDTLINGELYIDCGNAEIAGKTKVDTKCTIESANEPKIDENADLNNCIFNKVEEDSDSNSNKSDKIADFIKKTITSIIYAVVVAMITIALSNKIKTLPEKYTASNIALNILIGLATLIFVPIVSIALLFIPCCYSVGLALLLVYILLCVLSIGIGETIIGKLVANKFNKSSFWHVVGFTALIALLIQLIILIPVLGPILFFVIMLLGLGSVIVEMFRKTPN